MSDASASEPWTIGRLLTWTTDYLKKQQSSSARLDAEVLLAHALGCQRIALYTRYGEVVDDTVRAKFRDLVKRRGEGAPVAYLVGEREFFGFPFIVNKDVLIPRPETEHAVTEALDHLKTRPDLTAPRVLDVGTGSGCIAIAIALRCPTATVLAVDASPNALAVAKQNVERHKASERVKLLESDLLSAIPADERFDVIVSNPPYLSDAELKETARDVQGFEPHSALVAGSKGTEVIERFLPQAASRIEPKGLLVIELSPMIATAVQAMASYSGDWTSVKLVKDLAQLARLLVATRAG